MTKEQKIEAISWLIDMAEFVRRGSAGVTFPGGTYLEACMPSNSLHVFGSGFYEFANAASQEVRTEAYGEGIDRDYFMFDGVMFYSLKDSKGDKDAES